MVTVTKNDSSPHLLFFVYLATLSTNSVCKANSDMAPKNLESRNQVIHCLYDGHQISNINLRSSKEKKISHAGT